ncbi:MAG: hypothetical protein H8E57_07010 [Candidatus Cloacimonetes bacterium]|nr:hypothetical protein [Candidatus Cloacimonadota bacterium]
MEKIKTVEMVRNIRDKEYLTTKNMSKEELIDYFHKKAKSVNDEAIKHFQTRQNKV